MSASSTLPAPHLMPLMRYRDLAEAMGWLERAFGFEKQIAVADTDGDAIYGQMTYRGSLIMMGAVRDTDLDKLMRQPDEVGGVETQSCYIVVDDADAHYARATAEGAEIVLEIKSDGLGRRGYSCRDPQGHIWNFGTYNPGRGLTMAPVVVDETIVAAPAAPEAPPRRPRVLMGFVAALCALGFAGWIFADDIRSDIQRFAEASGQRAAAEAEKAYSELVKVRAEKRRADELAQSLKRDLEAERAQRAKMATHTEALAEAQKARLAAEAEAASLRQALKREQAERQAAIEAKQASEEKFAELSATRDAAPAPAAPETKREAPAPSSLEAAATSEKAQKIETSATGSAEPAVAAADDTDGDDRDREKAEAETARERSAAERRRERAAAKRAKKAAGTRPEPVPPTYVVNLREVPWPYNAWHK